MDTLKLYQITEQYLSACENLLNTQDEEITDIAIKDTLDGLVGDIQHKSLNVGAYYKNLQKQIEVMKGYETDMRKRRMVVENYSERLKNYLKENMEACDITNIKGPEFNISLRKRPQSVIVDDVSVLKDYYVRTEIIPDKKKIKDDLKKGLNVDGARLSDEYGTSIIIK